MQEDILINCTTTINNKRESWQATLKSITDYGNYYEATIEARSTHFDMLVGKTDNYYWVALPIQEISCSLAHPSDIFWNTERLCNLISIIDATTIASCITFIEHHKDILFSTKSMY